LSIRQQPNGFKFDFGSTVTILTTGVADIKHCRRVSGQGIFTGVVLEESEVNIKRSPKHVLISVDGLSKFQDDTETKGTDSCWHEHKPDDKQNDYAGHQPHGEDHDGYKNDRECEMKKTQEFVILSLTCPSFPFFTGQIVWISFDQIIAWAVFCSD
jgi:hypothetical protein